MYDSATIVGIAKLRQSIKANANNIMILLRAVFLSFDFRYKEHIKIQCSAEYSILQLAGNYKHKTSKKQLQYTPKDGFVNRFLKRKDAKQSGF